MKTLKCSVEFRAANFGVSSYNSQQNKQLAMYQMTKDGFSFLVMGYTGEKAGQFKETFINEFNKRELLLKNDDYILMRSQQILNERLNVLETNLAKATKTVDLYRPSMVYVQDVLRSESFRTINEIASELFTTAQSLNKMLHLKGIQYKQNGVWMLYAKYRASGYTKTQTLLKDNKSFIHTVWTEKGRAFIHSLFNENLANAVEIKHSHDKLKIN